MKFLPSLLHPLLAVVALSLLAYSGNAASIPGLVNTGLGTNGALLPTGATNAYWRLVQSADAATPGPNVIVVNDSLFRKPRRRYV